MNINELLETRILEIQQEELILKSTGINQEGIKFYDYHKSLKSKEFGLFSNIWLKLFQDQIPINKNVSVNIFFTEEYSVWSINKLINLTKYLHSKLGMSDDFMTNWEASDNNSVRNGTFSRFWHIDKDGTNVYEPNNETYMVGLSISPDLDLKSNKDCITLGIWNYQNSL